MPLCAVYKKVGESKRIEKDAWGKCQSQGNWDSHINRR